MKYNIILTDQESQRLQEMVAELEKQIAELDAKKWNRPQDETKGLKKKRLSQRKVTHARILLKAALASSAPSMTESSIAQDLEVDPELVELVCKQFVAEGLEAALEPILTNVEREKVDTWYKQFGKGIVLQVRAQLREVTKHRTGASTEAVAHSVWVSFMDNHLDESLDSTDPMCAWGILTRGAKRHCDAWNTYGKRHKNVSLEGLRTRRSDDLPAFDPIDNRETEPVIVLVRDECAALLSCLGKDEAEAVAKAIQAEERRTELFDQLTQEERHVFALKLSRKTRDEIALLLCIDHGEVDDLWESIQRKVDSFGEIEKDDEE